MVQRQEITRLCFLWGPLSVDTCGIVATDPQPLAEKLLRSGWSEVLSAQSTPVAQTPAMRTDRPLQSHWD
jgi:hypothetical protein